MINQEYLYKKQVNDFLNVHKNRFSTLSIQGKSGYCTKLTNYDNVTMNV